LVTNLWPKFFQIVVEIYISICDINTIKANRAIAACGIIFEAILVISIYIIKGWRYYGWL